ncbi:TetR/AcrR family transcriptional regulator [Azospirillum picis]|uniref:AcrR family transcriptional regulator n=1 Tax=Azospirillum picis TaxID=488438 RepID=A0ABU0MH58_9PROT|nr:TetR/AcrR family transcriptional regulator [Azospirillum picis]MBP2298968.1 AcrR family transcriptional regulator [Azospirillum picis]MDQ0532790.1 AcrR family transcriptional regulator [Azospirillum picis]
MTGKARQTGRRADALSKERIVEAAIAILDAEGEGALTFRTLAARLATGAGALYWHVADRGELMTAAVDHVLATALAGVGDAADPRSAIRAVALAVFDAVDAHPWAGGQLTREPWRPGALRLFEGIGAALLALGVPERARFDAWSALVNYIVGAAGQNAANAVSARSRPTGADRSAFLGGVAERWARLDPAEYPFVRDLAARMRDHDDREQFLAGIDIIVAGIEPLARPQRSPGDEVTHGNRIWQ